MSKDDQFVILLPPATSNPRWCGLSLVERELRLLSMSCGIPSALLLDGSVTHSPITRADAQRYPLTIRRKSFSFPSPTSNGSTEPFAT